MLHSEHLHKQLAALAATRDMSIRLESTVPQRISLYFISTTSHSK